MYRQVNSQTNGTGMAYRSCGKTPRILPHHFTLLILSILKTNIKHVSKLLSQTM
jgi:hypothetical protein